MSIINVFFLNVSTVIIYISCFMLELNGKKSVFYLWIEHINEKNVFIFII